MGISLTSVGPTSGHVLSEMFDLLIAVWSLTLTGARACRKLLPGTPPLLMFTASIAGTVIGLVGGLGAVGALAEFADSPLSRVHTSRLPFMSPTQCPA